MKSKLTEEDQELLKGLSVMLNHLVSLDGEQGLLPKIYEKAWPEGQDNENESAPIERLKMGDAMHKLQEAQEALAYLIPDESKD